MKKINIKQLELHNFKGIRDIKIDFKDETNIFGANASGKTTIADAFMWLLFNKDTNDRADFNIKTLDKNNEVIPQTNHSVKTTIEVNEEVIVLEKILKEKWTKQRGALEKTFTGNETEYYINDVPKKLKEFESYVTSIIDKEVFKMITSPSYFVSLNWKVQRDMLFKITEDINVDEMILQNDKYADLKDMLISKSTDDVKKELQAKKNKLSQDLDNIPARIDEVEKGKPSPYIADEERIKDIESKIETKEELVNGTNLDQYQDLIKNKNDIQVSLMNEEQTYNLSKQQAMNEFNAGPKAKLMEIENSISQINNMMVSIEPMKVVAQQLENDLNKAREENVSLKALQFVFSENDTKCPTCQRELDNASEIREQLEANFNTDKAKKLEANISNGKSLKEKLTIKQKEIETTIKVNEENTLEVEKLQQEKTQLLTSHKEFSYPDYVANQLKLKEIEQIDKELIIFVDLKTASEKVKIEIKELQQELADEKAQEYHNTLIEQADKRIAELKEQYNASNNAIANIERLQDLLMEFLKEKVKLTEDKINQNFLYTKFKMFNQLVNGGVEETCIATYNGVPYNDLNNAMKINIGLDIINALCIYFDTVAPIFIDNRESVTEIIKTDSQVVNLIVSSADKTLRIE